MIQSQRILLGLAIIILLKGQTVFSRSKGGPPPRFTGIICEGQPAEIACDSIIYGIYDISYGQTNPNSYDNIICPYTDEFDDDRCYADLPYGLRLQYLNEACTDNQSCAIPESSGIYGDQCDHSYKYMKFTFICNYGQECPLDCENGECNYLNSVPICQCKAGYRGSTCEEAIAFDCDDNNPCNPDVLIPNQNLYQNADPAKFVQCSAHGGCNIMDCQPGTIFNQSYQTCVHG